MASAIRQPCVGVFDLVSTLGQGYPSVSSNELIDEYGVYLRDGECHLTNKSSALATANNWKMSECRSAIVFACATLAPTSCLIASVFPAA